jgi:hypothetical protein
MVTTLGVVNLEGVVARFHLHLGVWRDKSALHTTNPWCTVVSIRTSLCIVVALEQERVISSIGGTILKYPVAFINSSGELKSRLHIYKGTLWDLFGKVYIGQCVHEWMERITQDRNV